ncbi:alpha/beta hydrolase [Streptomyces sp. NPDC006365]|uniref:alpha/beta hydrolase n=1 Tax=Streptomyces sp. NPDC006365 TaxID=3364744 RepID=UPI003693F427
MTPSVRPFRSRSPRSPRSPTRAIPPPERTNSYCGARASQTRAGRTPSVLPTARRCRKVHLILATRGTTALLTYEGAGHSVYGRSDCTRGAVDDYLAELKVPEDGSHAPRYARSPQYPYPLSVRRSESSG